MLLCLRFYLVSDMVLCLHCLRRTAAPKVLEVGMLECLLGRESLIWVIGTEAGDEVNAAFGGVLEQRRHAGANFVRKVEVHMPRLTKGQPIRRGKGENDHKNGKHEVGRIHIAVQ